VELAQRPLSARAAQTHEGGLTAVRHRLQRGPDAAGEGNTPPFESPLKEIPRAIEEFANEPPAAEARLQPQRWTLKQVFTGGA